MKKLVIAMIAMWALVASSHSAHADVPDGTYVLSGKAERLTDTGVASCGAANAKRSAKPPPKIEVIYGTGYVRIGRALTSVHKAFYDNGATTAFQWEEGADGFELQISSLRDGSMVGTYAVGRVKDGKNHCIDAFAYSAVTWTAPPPPPPLMPPGWENLPTQGAALAREIKTWKCRKEDGLKAMSCKRCRNASLPFPCAEMTVTDGPDLGSKGDGVFDHLFSISFEMSAKQSSGDAVNAILSKLGDPTAVAGATMWAACWRGSAWTTSLTMNVIRGSDLGALRVLIMGASADPCMTTDATVNTSTSTASFRCADPIADFRSSAEHLRRCGEGAAAYYFGGKSGLYRVLLTCQNSKCSATQFTEAALGHSDKIISDGDLVGTVANGVVDLSYEFASGFSRPALVKTQWTFSDGGILASIAEENELPDRRGNFTKSYARSHGTWFDCSQSAMCLKLVKRVAKLMPTGTPTSAGGSPATAPAGTVEPEQRKPDE